MGGGDPSKRGVLGSGSVRGTCKSFNGAHGYGFIALDDGSDIFVHIRDCDGSQPAAGDILAFDLVESPNRPGKMMASNVSGGTAPIESQKGDKGWGKGMMGGYGAYGGGGNGKGGWGGGGGYDAWGGSAAAWGGYG